MTGSSVSPLTWSKLLVVLGNVTKDSDCKPQLGRFRLDTRGNIPEGLEPWEMLPGHIVKCSCVKGAAGWSWVWCSAVGCPAASLRLHWKSEDPSSLILWHTQGCHESVEAIGNKIIGKTKPTYLKCVLTSEMQILSWTQLNLEGKVRIKCFSEVTWAVI